MRLTDILKKEAIISGLTARHKKEVLEELCKVVAANEGLESGPLLQVLLEREKLGSTGIGEGIAIPHGKVDNLDKILIAFGRSLDGVDFDSMDGQPTHLFFLILAPGDSAGFHLRVLAKISRLLKEPSFRQDVLKAEGREDIYQLIVARDNDF